MLNGLSGWKLLDYNLISFVNVVRQTKLQNVDPLHIEFVKRDFIAEKSFSDLAVSLTSPDSDHLSF